MDYARVAWTDSFMRKTTMSSQMIQTMVERPLILFITPLVKEKPSVPTTQPCTITIANSTSARPIVNS
jgi:hypothetical protein